MNRLLLRKYVAEAIWLWLACAVTLFAFCWMRVWIVCQFELDKFSGVLEQFKAFEKFTPVPLEQFLTHAGSIGMAYHEPVLILCVILFAIARGSDVVSGEVGRGTMEMLLAQPVTRSQLLWHHALVGGSGLLLLSSVAWLGTFFGIHSNSRMETITPTLELRIPFLPVNLPIPTGKSEQILSPLADVAPPEWFLPSAVNLFALGFFVFAMAAMLSSMDRYRWRTIGVAVGIYVIQLLTFLLSKSTEFTQWCGYFSFFSLYQPDGMVQLVRNFPEAGFELVSSHQVPGWPFWLGPLGMSGLLFTLGMLFLLVAWRVFNRRDLPAPV